MDEEAARDFFACNDSDDLNKLLAKLKEKSLNARMQYDPKFATSPIFVTNKGLCCCCDATTMRQ